MKAAPLIPGVKTALPREFDPHAQDADFEYGQRRLRVLIRDRYTCQGCGFQTTPNREAQSFALVASGYLEVHHIDNNHGNNSDSNMLALCPFCHGVHHIGIMATRGARVVLLPWLSQSQISLITNMAGVARARQGGELTRKAFEVYNLMRGLNSLVPEGYGLDVDDSDCEAWAGALAFLQRKHPSHYANRAKVMTHVRIIADLDFHKEALSWWSEHCWLSGENWETAWHRLGEQCHGV